MPCTQVLYQLPPGHDARHYMMVVPRHFYECTPIGREASTAGCHYFAALDILSRPSMLADFAGQHMMHAAMHESAAAAPRIPEP